MTAATDLLRALPPGRADEVVRLATRRKLRDGTVLFRQGDPAAGFYVLLSGRVKVSQTTPEGQETVMRFIAPGELFGCVPLIGEDAYPGTARAVELAEVLAWDAAATRTLLEKYPKLVLSVLHTIGGRLREFQERLVEASTERVERRLARALVRLAHQAGRRTEQGVRIELPITRAELAQMTGTTVYTVSRLLAEWQRSGIVATERRRLVVRRPHGLVAIAEELRRDT
ncbi:MAG: Crp/Fnr family transcriptional regulator [Chloroflexota bacterium]|nr:Crp/Fnr family transcriptional regulator [Chloroflexota bacterium]